MYTHSPSTQKAEPGYDSAFETSLGSSETLWKTNKHPDFVSLNQLLYTYCMLLLYYIMKVAIGNK